MRLRKTEQASQSWVLREAPEKKLHTRRKNLLEPLTQIHNLGCRGFEILFRSDMPMGPLFFDKDGQPW
jgi:hypothetical protein